MANTMLSHTGYKIGKSIYEHSCGNLIKEILENSGFDFIIFKIHIITSK